MSQFTPLVRKQYTFEGDTVSVAFARLKRKDFHKLAPHIKFDADTGKTKMSFHDQIEFSGVMAEVLPEYVKEFAGLKDSDGNAVTLQQALEEVYFMSLIGDVVSDLFESSNMKESEAKKSAPPLAGSSPE